MNAMNATFLFKNQFSVLFKNEFSVLGTKESVICGIKIDERRISFTGAVTEVENFGITAEELAVFAADAETVHFEREQVYIPVRGTKLNEKAFTEEISVLTVRAVADGEIVNAARISRLVCRW